MEWWQLHLRLTSNPAPYKGAALTFDAENRLTSYGGTVLTNGYRGDSLRAWKQNSSGCTYFLYSGSQLVCEFNSSGVVTATNTVGNAGLISRHTSSGSVFYAFDTHGSVSQRLSSSGSVLSTQTFDAYGNRLSTDNNTDPYAGYQGRRGYYTDWETGTASSALALLTFRYYDPSAGRFLTRDPIGYKGGANSYEYVNDNPTDGSDPLGTSPIWAFIGGCGGTIAGLLTNQQWSSCNAEYNTCLDIGDCLAEIAATAIGMAMRASAGFILAGCLEGAVSAMLHVGVEYVCRKLFNPCAPEDNPICTALSVIGDTISGCVDGLIGNWLSGSISDLGVYAKEEMEELNEQLEGVFETFMSALGMGFEANCSSFAPPSA